MISRQIVCKRISKREESYLNFIGDFYECIERENTEIKNGQINMKIQITVAHVGEKIGSIETKGRGE